MAQKNRQTSRALCSVTSFVRRHFRHFNAAVLKKAAEEYASLIASGGKMLISMAGAMSTAELGISLAEMIRRGKVHAICCTGANLEEDVFNLVAHDDYVAVPNYRELSPRDELRLLKRHLNRVTDTCIPEETAMRRIERELMVEYKRAEQAKERHFPHEFVFSLLRSGRLRKYYQIEPRDSWVVSALEHGIPIFVPGWEDSTLGNMFAARCITGEICDARIVKTGIEYMIELVAWYQNSRAKHPVGYFQIGGGIAGDFAICAVPLIRQDLRRRNVGLWSYFCQISDSTTSYGSYSGAVPNEKITWEKLAPDTPRFVIESDATIVAPLIFALVLGW